MKRTVSFVLVLAFVLSFFTAFSFSASANGLLSASSLENRLGQVIANIDPYGDSCYFNEINPLSIGYWVWERNCDWDSHSAEHNEYPPGSGHCAQYIGQCTWYAYGRFLEVYGVALKGRIPNAADWLNVIPQNNASQGVVYSTNGSKPIVGSIFVKNNSYFGHVGFVEGISDDGQYVYYTDANYNISGSKTNLFDKTDGQVRRKTLSSFISGVAGYIYMNKNLLPDDIDGKTTTMHAVVTSNYQPSTVNVRSSPSGGVVGSLFYRDVVAAYPDSVTSYNGLDWIKIKYGSGVGWVAEKYLRDGIPAQTENIGRALTETELEDSVGVICANTASSAFDTSDVSSGSSAWYARGRFNELTGISLNGVVNDGSQWLTSVASQNAAAGVVVQYGGTPQEHSVYIDNDNNIGIIEGFSSDGSSSKEYVYYSSAASGYKLKKASTSSFAQSIKGYLYSHFVAVSQLNLDTATIAITAGEAQTVNATVLPDNASDKAVRWSSKNTSVATVENGRVTGVSAGETTITATSSNGLSQTVSVRVFARIVEVSDVTLSPSSGLLDIGNTLKLNAYINPSDATDISLIWLSSNTSVATVNNGVVQAVSAGKTTITAIASSGVSGTAEIIVNDPYVPVSGITLSNQSLSLEKGRAERVTATLLPLNATNKAVTYSSSNSDIVSVSPLGIIYAKNFGTATITATALDGGFSAECSVSVYVGETCWSEWLIDLPADLPAETIKQNTIMFSYKMDGVITEPMPYSLKDESISVYDMYFVFRYELPWLYGDCNYNNELDVSDALILFQFIAGKRFDVDVRRGDMNRDNLLSLSDAMLLFLAVSGKN